MSRHLGSLLAVGKRPLLSAPLLRSAHRRRRALGSLDVVNLRTVALGDLEAAERWEEEAVERVELPAGADRWRFLRRALDTMSAPD